MLRRTLSVLTVIAALGGSALLPASALAKDRDKDKEKHKGKNKHRSESRVYDRAHRDYHRWDGDEDRLYRQYLTEQHHPYRELSRMNTSERRAYWQWRHQHQGR